jgi:hypothetical protein
LRLSFWNDLRDARWNSRLVRGLLGMFYREGRVYRVPFGPLRGFRCTLYPAISHVILRHGVDDFVTAWRFDCACH